MTIRILQVIPTLVRGGAEKQLTLLATRLPRDEFDVHVAVLTHDGPYHETLDRLSGDWWIFQLRRGHRYATDDVLTAWAAVTARPEAKRVLDLGAGVGSVGLMALRVLAPDARLTSVEVLEESAALLARTCSITCAI